MVDRSRTMPRSTLRLRQCCDFSFTRSHGSSRNARSPAYARSRSGRRSPSRIIRAWSIHPSPDWLREHGINPEKAGCVEIANAKNFLACTLDQPWRDLHELAHSYHDKVLGFENPAVDAAYQAAVASKTCESVLRISGRIEKHYALTDAKGYFAEGSEAYFGTNDFYPFVRAELRKHDPVGDKMLQEAWGIV